MSDLWATSGLDLHLELAGSRRRAILERALRDAVRSGRLQPGTRLPSSRALAQDLQLARNTVAEAYGQLIAEGWLLARQGSGTRVADRATESRAAPPHAVAPSAALWADTDRRRAYDLRPGSPDLSSFPRSAWVAATRRALLAAPADALGYGDPRGRPELRNALADYLARARDVRVTPERIVVCSGFTQALALLCRVLAARGATTLATEAYGLHSNYEIVADQGLRTRALNVDAYGATIDGAGDADAALVTPAHQFPLGVALSPARRSQLVTWAADRGGLVIEDDYDGEFRYDRQPVGALQALAPGHVIYVGTSSKTIAPGLRLAWMVVPDAVLDEIVQAKALADRQTGSLDQLVLADLITSGVYDRHIRRSRLAYRKRRDHLVTQLNHHQPRVRVAGVAAGLHAVIELPTGQTEADVMTRATAHGLTLQGLDYFRGPTAEPHPPALVVGYATPPTHAYTGAIARLCAALRKGNR